MTRRSPDLSWQDHAACRGHDLYKLFDPIPFGTGIQQRDYLPHRIALWICKRCPVLNECQHWALTQYTCDSSIAGGMTGAERRQYRQQHMLDQPQDPQDLALCGHPSLDGICLCNRPRKASA